MSDRKGHRKLRLCSNKYYEKRKYFPKKLIVAIPRNFFALRVSIPINLLPFRVSLPLSIFTELSVPSVEILHERILRLGTLSKGIVLHDYCLNFKCITLFRVESHDKRGNPDPLPDDLK